MDINAAKAKVGSGRSAVLPERPRELQDALNRRLYHPLARRLALLLSHTAVTPNMVSVAGAFLVVAAAVVYVQPFAPFAALLGLLIHMSWHVVDGADGDLARLTGRSGPKGEIVDGICDYASHVVLYLVLGFHLQQAIGPVAWVATLGAGFSRIVQANHYEALRRQYQWWAYGVPWLRQSSGSGAEQTGGAQVSGVLSRAYVALAGWLVPDAAAIDSALQDRSGEAAGGVGSGRRGMESVVRGMAGVLLPPRLLGANYRTLMLGVSMLAGSPLYYFLYEAVMLNGVLLVSIARSRRAVVRLGAVVSPLSTRR
ncbi:CDP-alcohol phosphatidyltransferase family protein [Novosphingobium guangzhouense]|uniref:CDP-alcohol phosphatidyltransferase n=1 Tax=Novosphingobium guangzhouense TaxID=1850347 RepID=A0A2K2G2D4_9SPHN|nr:CDP-alcohol phosphatidyltransferase family protein [Novosphingobium guangzhouense]PNU05162.1 hypothetical protein A8V01_04470 [Novosphingobium guangzhouense]